MLKNRLTFLIAGITLVALVLTGIACTVESGRVNTDTDSPIIVTVDDLARYPERYTDFVGVSVYVVSNSGTD